MTAIADTHETGFVCSASQTALADLRGLAQLNFGEERNICHVIALC